MTCEQAVRQFFAYLDQVLSGEALESFEEHLEACFDCCERLQFSRRLDGFVRARLGAGMLPEGIEERLRRTIARARADEAGPGRR